MVIPLKVVDQGGLLSSELTEKLRDRARKLAHFFGGLEECRLTVDGPGQHHLSKRVRVRLYLSVSGIQIAVSHQSGEDLPAALRSAFDAAARRLKAHARLARTTDRANPRKPGSKRRPQVKRASQV